MRALATSFLLMLPIASAQAEIVRSAAQWTATGSFSTRKDANTALSGVACATGTARCIAVNDEARFAQFFKIDGHSINPGALIALLPKQDTDGELADLDAEGAAYAPPRRPGENGYYYITGSHGLSHRQEQQRSRYFVVRFPVNAETGKVDFSFDEDARDAPSGKVKASPRLTAALATLPALAPAVDRALQQQGLNIEGLAVTGDSLLFGLRSPCINRQAFVVTVPIEALFGSAPPSATLAALSLGDNTGIRDLARVSDGILILSGRSDDNRSPAAIPCGDGSARPAPAVWFWSGTPGAEAQPLGPLPGLSAGDAAETLQLLAEDATSYRVLVWLDNVADGAPSEFIIPKPR